MGIVLLIFLLLIIFYVFLVINFDYWKKRGVAGPKPRPLFGNTPNMLLQKRNFQDDIIDIYREYKGKESFVGIFNLRKPQLLVIDPKVVQEVMITKFKSFNKTEFADWTDKKLDPILGRNPFLLTGEEWKEKRAEITPALTTNRIKASYPIMLSVCSKMTNYLERQAQSPPADGLDVKELCARYTTEVVSNCIYGIEAGAFNEGHCVVREMGAAIFDQSVLAMFYTMVMATMPKCMRKIYRRPFVEKHIENYFTDLMNQAVKIRKETKSDRIDFLNYLLQLQEKKNLSNLDMAAHTLTFFVDGFETSSILISNCLRCLAENKDAQQRLRNEINKSIEKNGEVSYETLLELPFLDQCINETLRLYSPAIAVNKMTTEKCELVTNKDKRVTIEKDTVVIIPYFAIHRDPEYYANPEKYDPDRFSPENGGTKKYKDMGVFFPFGDGPRMCIGMRFALCQSKAAIVELVRNWEMTINPKTKPTFTIDPRNFMCTPEGGTWVDFKRIEN